MDPNNDLDHDGICGDIDACPLDPNNDSDSDGFCSDIDICPGFDDNEDSDFDTIPDGCDNCPFDINNDSDSDGFCGDIDICPGFNDGENSDADSIPDGCDICPFDTDNYIDDYGICGGNNDGNGTCENSPIIQNSFTMLSGNSSDEMQVVYHSTSPISSFEYIINWCSNSVEDYACPPGFSIFDSGIEEWTQIETNGWIITTENFSTYTRIIGTMNNEFSQDILDSGCGVLSLATYRGSIHSVENINWSGLDNIDLGFNYDSCENCENYLDAEYAEKFSLNQNYPNPFNPYTNIEFYLDFNDYIELNIYDIKGRKVKTLLSEFSLSGSHLVKWDGKNKNGDDLPSGIYLYQLVNSQKMLSNKMILLR